MALTGQTTDSTTNGTGDSTSSVNPNLQAILDGVQAVVASAMETKTIGVHIHHPDFSEIFPKIRAVEAQGWKVVQMLTLTHAVGKGPVQDQTLIFRLER